MRARRLAVVLGVVVALLLACGFAYERVAQRRLAQRYPAPGRLVDVGGRHLHLHCVGEGGPTVVVEAGSGSWSNDWQPALELLASRGRACAYDRPGYGWSDPAPGPATASRIVRDLRRALAATDEAGPFVLVGHSLGGLYARAWARARPEEVVGLVLLDARHEDANAALPEAIRERERRMSGVYRLARGLARFGVVRALGPRLLPPSGLPEAQAEVFWAQATSPRFFATVQGELDALTDVETRLRGARHGVPVVVVRHGVEDMFGEHPAAEEAERVWRRLQEDLARRADRGIVLVAEEAGHNVQIDRPGIVLDAVEALEELAGSAS